MNNKTYIHFDFVASDHKAIDARLCNWAASIKDGGGLARLLPMFRYYRSPATARRDGEVRIPVDQKDAAHMAKLVRLLPIKHWQVICWYYVSNESPGKGRKRLGLTQEDLFRLLQDARQMLVNFAGVKNK